MNEKCQNHYKVITHICKHAQCLKFYPLCEDCYSNHLEYHKNLKHKLDFSYIISYDECSQETNKILNRIREELERTQDKATTELTIQVSSNIDEVLMEIESIRHQINHLFDRYIQGLKEKFEQKIKIKIHRVYDEIKQNIETVKDFMKQSSSLSIMKMIHQNDLDYQVQYQKSHLENLITQRVNQKFQGRIDDDIALHFIGVIQKELDNLVVDQVKPRLNSISHSNQQMTKSLQQTVNNSKGTKQFKSFATVQLESNSTSNQINDVSIHRNWLFYFEPNTKNFHYIDVTKSKNSQFITQILEIDFQIPQGGRGLYAEDGKIYYICGYDESRYSEDNEDHLKTIYQLDFERRTLKPVARMVTLRNNFDVVSSSDYEIYIIGGENHKEGCLTKCEKISLKTNQITIINHLTEPSSLHACAIYHNQYIFKIGGCRINIPNQRQICSSLVYFYNIERDEWLTIDFPREIIQPQYTLLSSALQVNDNSIYVFGGIQENNQVTQQAYLLLIEEEEQFDQKDNISFQIYELQGKDLGFLFKLNYQPLKQAGLCLAQPQLINNSQIFAMIFPDIKGSSWMLQVFDKKWKDL